MGFKHSHLGNCRQPVHPTSFSLFEKLLFNEGTKGNPTVPENSQLFQTSNQRLEFTHSKFTGFRTRPIHNGELTNEITERTSRIGKPL